MCQHADSESHLTPTPPGGGEGGGGGGGGRVGWGWKWAEAAVIHRNINDRGKLSAPGVRPHGDTLPCASRFYVQIRTEAPKGCTAPTPISHWNQGSRLSATGIAQLRYSGGKVQNTERKIPHRRTNLLIGAVSVRV